MFCPTAGAKYPFVQVPAYGLQRQYFLFSHRQHYIQETKRMVKSLEQRLGVDYM